MSLNALLKTAAQRTAPVEPMTLMEFVKGWKTNESFRLNTTGRLRRAIGDPLIIDTSNDDAVRQGLITKHERERLARMHAGAPIYVYAPFRGKYFGIEQHLHRIVKFLELASSDAQQSRQILYVCGPTGAMKSTLASDLKRLYETQRVPVLGYREDEASEPVRSPTFEGPFGVFDAAHHGATLLAEFGIPTERLMVPMSRWAADLLQKDGGFDKFCVLMIAPSIATRTCIARVEPGDEKTGVGILVGTRGESGKFTDYDYSGGLNRTTQGILEFSEMFNARPQVLKPLLSAPQDRVYAGDGDVGELPYEGLIFAHSNEPGFTQFKNDLVDEALIDRICKINFPYNLSVTEERKIYRLGLDNAGFKELPVTPGALEVAAMFAMPTRVVKLNRMARVRAYDGRPIDVAGDTTDKLRASSEWRDGMDGISPRKMLGWLAAIAAVRSDEHGLDPITILEELRHIVVESDVDEYNELVAEDAIKHFVVRRCDEAVTLMIQRAFPDQYEDYMRDKFSGYFGLLDSYLDKEEHYKLNGTTTLSRNEVDQELTKIEIPIIGVQDLKTREVFRREVWKPSMPFFEDRVAIPGELPWSGLPENTWLKFEQGFLPTRSDMLPTDQQLQDDKTLFTIAFIQRDNAKDKAKHDAFVSRLCAMNTDAAARTVVTPKQARRMVEYYITQCR